MKNRQIKNIKYSKVKIRVIQGFINGTKRNREKGIKGN